VVPSLAGNAILDDEQKIAQLLDKQSQNGPQKGKLPTTRARDGALVVLHYEILIHRQIEQYPSKSGRRRT
jgi:hypothetical protein